MLMGRRALGQVNGARNRQPRQVPRFAFLRSTLFILTLLGWMGVGCAQQAAPRAEGLVVAAPGGFEAGAVAAAASAYSAETGQQVQVVAPGQDAYTNEIAAALLAGLDRYDLVYLPADSLGRWAKYHAIQPVGLLNDPDLAAWLPPLTVRGELYGLPAQVSIEVLWYRADLLADGGLPVPATWEQARAAALTLNAPPDLYGFALAGSDMDTASEYSAVLAGFGGQAVAPDRSVTISGKAALAALNWYAGLYLKDHAAPPETLETTRSQVIDRLAEGKAVFGIAPLEAGTRLRDCGASPAVCREGRALLEWTWLPGLPETVSTGALHAWAVPARAAQPQAAWRFARWLGSVEGARVWAMQGGTPANRRVLGERGSGGEILARIEDHRLALPSAAGAEQLWQAYHIAVRSALSGEAPPAEALEAAASEMEIILYRDDY